MKKPSPAIIKPLVGIAVLALIVYGAIKAASEPVVTLQGQLEAKETNIASKVSGRISHLYVEEGQHISVGDPIFRMNSPEIAAKVAQAKAARDAARAIFEKAESGARSQEIQMAHDQMKRAQAGLDASEKTWKRVNKLASEGLLSKQKQDQAKAQFISAQEQYKAAKAQYSMAKEGARKEDIAAAKAQAQQGQAVVAEALVAERESQLTSPVSGEVAQVMPNPGEIVAKGVPVITVVDLSDQRLEINVREDYLKHFTLGTKFTGTIPAFDDQEVEFVVYASAVLPDFATWRPTRTDQGFDMRTFIVKARPSTPVENMRPGMSVLITLPEGE